MPLSKGGIGRPGIQGDTSRDAKVARLSVVVPVSDAAATLERCLAALTTGRLPRRSIEIIVVDDGSSDGSALIACRHADTVVRLPGAPHGPAYARNRGAEVARAPILAFVDADVRVHPDALERMVVALERDASLGAVYGTYDVAPSPGGMVSQYRNLIRHFVHLRHAGETDVFWSACGAVRRSVFMDAGMYDEWRFPRPQLEGVELGHRIRRLGFRILLDPGIQGAHMKAWTLKSLLVTDARDRGVPRTRLLHADAPLRRDPDFLRDTGRPEVLGAGLVVVWLAAALALGGATWMYAVACSAVGLVILNRRLYAFFSARRGHGFAVVAVGLHLLAQLCHASAMAMGWVLRHVVGETDPEPLVQALSEVGVQTWPPVPVKSAIEGGPPGTR